MLEIKEFDFDSWRKNFLTDEMKEILETRGEVNCYREKHLTLLHSAMKKHYEAAIYELNEHYKKDTVSPGTETVQDSAVHVEGE